MLQFPIKLTANGSAKTVEGIDLLKQNLVEIFCIPLGTDFFQGQRGSRLHLIRGERNESIIRSLATTYCKEVFLQSEIVDLAEYSHIEIKIDQEVVRIKVFFNSKITGESGGVEVTV